MVGGVFTHAKVAKGAKEWWLGIGGGNGHKKLLHTIEQRLVALEAKAQSFTF